MAPSRDNEFDSPGVNYPDRGDDHADGKPHVPGEQAQPLLEQNDATLRDKVAGIVEQTRADVGDKPREEFIVVLHQRLAEAGIDMPTDDVGKLLKEDQ